MKYRLIYGALVLVALSGCASYSGLDADSKFSCKAPDGVTCMSVSGIYANAKANNLPAQRQKHDDGQPKGPAEPVSGRGVPREYGAPENSVAMLGTTEKTSPKAMSAPNSGAPLRTPERILRVWLAPFEDQEGDLHDQKYFYVTVNSGAWTIEANRVNIRQKFQQVYPLSKGNPANKRADGEGQQQTPQQAAAATLPISPVQQQSNNEDQ